MEFVSTYFWELLACGFVLSMVYKIGLFSGMQMNISSPVRVISHENIDGSFYWHDIVNSAFLFQTKTFAEGEKKLIESLEPRQRIFLIEAGNISLQKVE